MGENPCIIKGEIIVQKQFYNGRKEEEKYAKDYHPVDDWVKWWKLVVEAVRAAAGEGLDGVIEAAREIGVIKCQATDSLSIKKSNAPDTITVVFRASSEKNLIPDKCQAIIPSVFEKVGENFGKDQKKYEITFKLRTNNLQPQTYHCLFDCFFVAQDGERRAIYSIIDIIFEDDTG